MSGPDHLPGDGGITLRPATAADGPAILELLQACLGWAPGGPLEAFFAWKHGENAFGPSPAWLAVHDGRMVGFRTFMRWELEHGHRWCRAARAVDTATHPDYRGQGIFSRLTQLALEQLRTEGVAVVFNTPNEKSRPGYLKMGWTTVGRLPVLFRPRTPASVVSMARARAPADKWSVPTSACLSAPEVLADTDAVAGLLARLPSAAALHTRRSPAFLAWRYGFAPLAYRVALVGAKVEDGIVVFRLRRRGPALESVVSEVLVPGDATRALRSTLGAVLRSTRADYAIRLGGPGVPRLDFLPLPGQGPILVRRHVDDSGTSMPTGWQLSLGDVELF
ncbi:MAG: GNAT family N-acetyltransferase [Acidimicrobiales bacterium]